MADSLTPHYNLLKPEISGSANTWGNKLNENADAIDGILFDKAAKDMSNVSKDTVQGAFGLTVSSDAPSGGADGDVWFRLE